MSWKATQKYPEVTDLTDDNITSVQKWLGVIKQQASFLKRDWHSSVTNYSVTRPQWVSGTYHCLSWKRCYVSWSDILNLNVIKWLLWYEVWPNWWYVYSTIRWTRLPIGSLCRLCGRDCSDTLKEPSHHVSVCMIYSIKCSFWYLPLAHCKLHCF